MSTREDWGKAIYDRRVQEAVKLPHYFVPPSWEEPQEAERERYRKQGEAVIATLSADDFEALLYQTDIDGLR